MIAQLLRKFISAQWDHKLKCYQSTWDKQDGEDILIFPMHVKFKKKIKIILFFNFLTFCKIYEHSLQLIFL